MAEVKIISTCLVQAATPPMADHQNHRIDLTPWALQLLLFDPIQTGILIQKPTPQQQQELLGDYTVIDLLKLSLSKTLDHFPPLAGRLRSQKHDDDADNTVSFYIDCNNLGAQFTHAVADDVTMADIITPTYVPAIVHSLFSLNGVPNWEGISKPLLAVQMTELADGIFIGCTVNHCVGDGMSFWNFFYSWCQIAMGSEEVSVPVEIKPWVPDGTKLPIRIQSWNELIREKFIPPLFKERIFRFPKEAVAQFKSKANSLANNNNNNNGIENNMISSFQALLAYLWLTITRCRYSNFQNNYDGDEEVTLLLLIDARDRLTPPLPKGYFGNAVYTRAITCTVANLLKNDVGWAAKLIHDQVTLQTSEEVKKWYVDWTKNPKILKKREVLRNTLAVSGSPRFNLYDNDIKPVAVRSGMGNKYDGMLTVFAGSKDGEVDVEVCLSPETMHALETDQEILEATAVKKSAHA